MNTGNAYLLHPITDFQIGNPGHNLPVLLTSDEITSVALFASFEMIPLEDVRLHLDRVFVDGRQLTAAQRQMILSSDAMRFLVDRDTIHIRPRGSSR